MSSKKTLQEKRAKVELTNEIVRKCLWNPDTYDEYKNIADDGGMEGVKDAAHLEEIINKAAAGLSEAHWKEIINKHRNENILSQKNRNDLPNDKLLPTLGQVKKANWRPKKKKDAFHDCVPGHYGANQ